MTRPTPFILPFFLLPVLATAITFAQDAAPPPPAATSDKLPHIHVDLKAHQLAIECQALNVNIPLEFFCVIDGGNEHESVLRTPAKPSDIHFALLMLGLTPGAPATFQPAKRVWLPPHGPPLHISCRYLLNGKPMDIPAYRLMRSMKTKKEMPPSVWVFDGSRVMPDGTYAADITGYVVSICNFDLTLIDVPSLVSNANETLEWEYNPDLVPPKGTDVTMIIEPAAASDLPPPPTGIAADKFNPGPGLSGDVPPAPAAPAASPTPATAPPTSPAAPAQSPAPDNLAPTSPPTQPAADAADLDALQQKWNQVVASKGSELRQAAEAHYDLIAALRRKQQQLIEQSDQIQRSIDTLEKQYQDLTSPHPDSAAPSGPN